MAPPNETGEDIAMRRRRMRYRAWHRGTKEMDLILGPYADARAADMDPEEMDRFERLLDLPDTDLLSWVLGQEPTPLDADPAMIDRLRHFRQSQAAQQ